MTVVPKEVQIIIKQALRQVWMRSKVRGQALKAARHDKRYTCNSCKHSFSSSEVQVDHIVEIGRFTDWTSWIEKLFCPIENLQVLCKSCHQQKTKVFLRTSKASSSTNGSEL